MTTDLLSTLRRPPRGYSVLPFWFWNDDLDERELVRQIADFDAHGVHGFVIHPRVGLPRWIGWMSEEMLRFMGIAIAEAARRDMSVLLYDEGMYPSGSSCGQVVETDPTLACRCLSVIELSPTKQYVIDPEVSKVAELSRLNGQRILVVDRPVDSVIRGLHYLDDSAPRTPGKDPPEDTPRAGDILNPRTTQTVIQLVHEKFYERFGRYFGKTIKGIFTDEPGPLGRCREKRVFPGTTGIVEHVSRLLGYDFEPFLPTLWFDDEIDAKLHRERYRHAIRLRLEETWYAPLSEWCAGHGVALCGHPDAGDEIGVQRHFHVPGQDLVWRWVEPGKTTAFEGAESTQGKCSASAKLHHGRQRNSNEFCGAYGPQTTFAEMKWLADWLFVRGVDMLIPHAFYYSTRGPRRDERPPQLGPHQAEWLDGRWKHFAEHCTRMSWINGIGLPLCDVAILTHDDRCPWRAAKVLFENQVDFHYLEPSLIASGAAVVTDMGIDVRGQQYHALIIDGPDTPISDEVRRKLAPLERMGGVLWFDDSEAEQGNRVGRRPGVEEELLAALRMQCEAARFELDQPAPSLRVRSVRIGPDVLHFLHNEGTESIERTLTFHADVPLFMLADIGVGPVDLAKQTNPVPLRMPAFGTALFVQHMPLNDPSVDDILKKPLI
ncbi:MAG: glycosyl hydrolase [Tepidisphaeraceae bacterium]